MAFEPQKDARKRLQDGLVTRSKPLTLQLAALQASFGYGQFRLLQCCKNLKNRRFPAFLRLVSNEIAAYHFDPVYGSVT